ncbi:glutaredoxin family protein [Microbacterium sp. 77mftsu3.1]|uniref:glutaredoxin family protein n=1 Tax=Microbacterium sp. 77mftsu3.1 TaxID=1761802 RepID=UPI00036CE6B5|nr:glutaredoxin family protein [Microbacterium sp. 77mftsu3.1]
MTALTLISKPDCHLCDVAREIVDTVVADLPEGQVEVRELSIADDAELYSRWWEKIPVVLIDGDLHAHWRLSADRLRAALAEKDRA